MTTKTRPRVVILGAGFAGIIAARALKSAAVDVVIVDRQNHHLFQPLLYQVATAALAAPDIAAPVRKIFRHQKNVTVLLDEIVGIDVKEKRVRLAAAPALAYDALVVATGARHGYFGHPEWERTAPGLKTIGDAFEIRRRILYAFEAAERSVDEALKRAYLTFVVVGGGPTGVELAGAIGEIAQRTIVRDFRNFDPKSTRVILVEAGPRILSTYPDALSQKAVRQLEQLGVTVRTGAAVTSLDESGVTLGTELLPARTVLWAAGVDASPLGRDLGSERERNGRVHVASDLSLPNAPEVFVAGDLAYLIDDGKPVPAVAPAAMQMGRTVAKNVVKRLAGEPTEKFKYLDKGTLATIGRRRAVGVIGPLQLSGMIAWLGWLFIHLMYVVGFRNRLAVLFDWAWAYVTYQRSARVIVEPAPYGLRGHADLPTTSGPVPVAERVPSSSSSSPTASA